MIEMLRESGGQSGKPGYTNDSCHEKVRLLLSGPEGNIV